MDTELATLQATVAQYTVAIERMQAERADLDALNNQLDLEVQRTENIMVPAPLVGSKVKPPLFNAEVLTYAL